MKKLIASVFAAGLVSAGLVAAGGTAAQADPYPGQFATTTKAKVPSTVRAGKIALCAKTKPVGSNVVPTGEMVFKVERIGGGFDYDKTVNYTGGKVCVTKRLKPGSYVLEVEFSSNKPVLADSEDAKGFRVIRPAA